jgi:hypothetical protein
MIQYTVHLTIKLVIHIVTDKYPNTILQEEATTLLYTQYLNSICRWDWL